MQILIDYQCCNPLLRTVGLKFPASRSQSRLSILTDALHLIEIKPYICPASLVATDPISM
jgi:hypothetical protein